MVGGGTAKAAATAAASTVSSAAFQVEVAVIGAGVVGLAIARSLAMVGKEVLILDRASMICSGKKHAFLCRETSKCIAFYR